jgi:hypothetical protein
MSEWKVSLNISEAIRRRQLPSLIDDGIPQDLFLLYKFHHSGIEGFHESLRILAFLIRPKISADERTDEMMRFMVLLPVIGGCSLALGMERALGLEEDSTIPAGHLRQTCSWSDAYG